VPCLAYCGWRTHTYLKHGPGQDWGLAKYRGASVLALRLAEFVFRCALVAPRQGEQGGGAARQALFGSGYMYYLCDKRAPSIN
jgi:hypothetical protein